MNHNNFKFLSIHLLLIFAKCFTGVNHIELNEIPRNLINCCENMVLRVYQLNFVSCSAFLVLWAFIS